MVRVEVSDRGKGVPDEEAERIFEPFQRGDGSRSSGIGLAICKAIVTAHDGEISVERTFGGGATFTFTLPIHRGSGPDMTVVLVVDDEPAIRRSVSAGLSARDYEVRTASTGEEALASVAADPPDLVILDLGLPDLDGVDVCRRLRQWTQVPIVVLSAEASDYRKVLALDEGADDYLTKPFSMPELLARVRVALRHRTGRVRAGGGDGARRGRPAPSTWPGIASRWTGARWSSPRRSSTSSRSSLGGPAAC